MVRPRTSRVRLDSKRTSALAYRPHLEEIEARVLPGETVGLGLLASYALFARGPSLLANQEAEFSIADRAVPSAKSSGSPQPAAIPQNTDLNNTRPPALSASRNAPAPIVTTANGTSTVPNAPAADLANELFDSSALFAPGRPAIPQAPASANAASNAHGSAGGFAMVPLLGSSASSSLGVPGDGSAAHAAIANPAPPSAGLSNSGPIPQHGLTAVHDLNGPSWSSYAHDPQHTAISDVPSQSLQAIHWQTPVDLNPQSYGGDLYIHYGSPVVTAANTVIVPVKTGANDGFEVE
ncbi:MAG TPA: hypothetical protein VKU02_06820, partial [Gemmataceae bacterium]|nr:hypothetical protein [Gemmataceae bacterium]